MTLSLPDKNITHPLIVGTRIRSRLPVCPCSGISWKLVEGTIKFMKEKRVRGEQKFFYVLDSGYKVNQDWITNVLI